MQAARARISLHNIHWNDQKFDAIRAERERDKHGMDSALIIVAAGVIRRPDGRILLSLRPTDAHQGGLWEFPGGKVERSERAIEALTRELYEELGLRVRSAMPLIRIAYEYPDRRVDLRVFEVTEWSGEPYGREGQQVAWFAANDLSGVCVPAANDGIRTAAQLPDLAICTSLEGGQHERDIASLESYLKAGIRLIRLSTPASDDPDLLRTLAQAADLCRIYGARMTVCSARPNRPASNLYGVHVSANDLRGGFQPPSNSNLLTSASCQNRSDLDLAEKIGVDFVYLEYLQPPASVGGHGRQWRSLRAASSRLKIPAYACGSVSASDAFMARSMGCQGVALACDLGESCDMPGVVATARFYGQKAITWT